MGQIINKAVRNRDDRAALLHWLQGKAGAFPDVQHVVAFSKLKWLFCTFLLSGGALADGFQVRMFEFQNFERRFEVSVMCTNLLRFLLRKGWGIDYKHGVGPHFENTLYRKEKLC